jgi:hypothetical protein
MGVACMPLVAAGPSTLGVLHRCKNIACHAARRRLVEVSAPPRLDAARLVATVRFATRNGPLRCRYAVADLFVAKLLVLVQPHMERNL